MQQLIRRLILNICSSKLQESKVFYTTLFDFEVQFDSDWFIQLKAKDQPLELGVIERTHAIVPKAAQVSPKGIYLTLVVERVDELYERVKLKRYEIIRPSEDTYYGQRRLLLRDPNGVVVDVSAPIPNFEFG